MKQLFLLIPLVCLLSAVTPVHGADKSLKVKISKVSSAKSRDREKLFSEWMTQNELAVLNDTKAKSEERLLFFEYAEGKDKYRAIHGKVSREKGYNWRTIYSEKAMLDDVKSYKTRGMEPAFITLEGNYYCMLFLYPEDLAAHQQILKDLGIEPPVIK